MTVRDVTAKAQETATLFADLPGFYPAVYQSATRLAIASRLASPLGPVVQHS